MMQTHLRILITSGGTREPIDDVRYIGNLSSGSTGAALARAFALHGHSVTLLHGTGSVTAEPPVDTEAFTSTADLWERLSSRVSTGNYDAVIMAAAVADYTPETAVNGKIRSDAGELILRLVRTPKLLPLIKSASLGRSIVVGFKLTSRATQEERRVAVALQWQTGGVDAIVQNDLEEIRRFPAHPFHLYRSSTSEPETIYGPADLASVLEAFVRAKKRL